MVAESEAVATEDGSEPSVPIVGVGASAGGIEAVKSMLSALPEQPGYALVVIQHKRPDSDQSLPKVLKTVTELPVSTIEDGDPIQTNHIYLNPARSGVQLQDNTFQLSPLKKDDLFYNPIDFFFEHLSESRKHNSTGVVLSGTGTDGTLGLKKIKYLGGITIAQDTESAQYPDMPESARETVGVDFVLPPEEIPARLADVSTHSYVTDPEVQRTDVEISGEYIEEILRSVHERTGHDLRGYKHKPIRRRLLRQLAVHQLPGTRELMEFLEQDPARLDALLRELLIDYSRFFRNQSTFRYLENEFFPDQFENHPKDQTYRVWVPGCSTGEEVYSLIMVMMEAMDRVDTRIPLKVFATDIHPKSLTVARKGFYPKEIEADLDEKWIRRYMIGEGGRYRVQSSVRDHVIFAEHNLLQDPPYSRIDFLSCRNLLIYLGEAQQQRALEILHYALRDNGHLLLGSTESVDRVDDLYTEINEEHKLYQKFGTSEDLDHPVLDLTSLAEGRTGTAPETETMSPRVVHRAEQRLIHQHGHPAVLLDQNHDAIHLFGETDRWLSYSPGSMDHGILEIVDEELRDELFDLLGDVSGDSGESSVHKLVEVDGSVRSVNLSVETVHAGTDGSVYYLVVFQELSSSQPSAAKAESVPEVDPDAEEQELREELESTRQYLKQSVERLKNKNQELRAKNRDLQALSEEYQSTNEELETSREELQSTNEELMTVNEKLKDKVQSLDELNNDMRNLLRATRIPVIFLDRDLNIKWFTPSATEIFNLIESDVGRELGDITSKLEDVELTDTAGHVLETLDDEVFDARTEQGKHYNIRMIPYREDEDVVGGVAITFLDVDDLRRAEQDALTLAEVVKHSNDAIIVIDEDGTIEQWNHGAERLYGYAEQEATGMQFLELAVESPDATEKRIDELMAGETVDSYRVRRRHKEGNDLDVWVSAVRIRDAVDREPKLVFIERNLDWLETTFDPEGLSG